MKRDAERGHEVGAGRSVRRWARPVVALLLLASLACTRNLEILPQTPPPARESAPPRGEVMVESSAEPQALPQVEAGVEADLEAPVDSDAVEAPAASDGPPAGVPSASTSRSLKVGLATDLPLLEVGCCARVAELGSESSTTRALRVEPAPLGTQAPDYRLQVGAFKDETQAQRLRAELASTLGEPVTSLFDAGTGLYRVRVGRYRTPGEAEIGKRKLRAVGVEDAWVAVEGGSLEEPGFLVRDASGSRRVVGRWLVFEPTGDEGIRVRGVRYRGRILAYLNSRASLNLINELSLDDYLRGVVPREMGPDQFSAVEALKAQAVAARTYTLRNLTEFDGEGYDICATPRCQVYGGLSAEHPLSDRAVLETSGEVLTWGKELVDALYSSTCGGHTESVATVFPRKDHPYLRGVSCDESGVEGPRPVSWKRFRTRSEIVTLVNDRYPGLGFERFELLERGVSGRVARVRLDGTRGRSIEIEGLAIRWTFDLPDTWFSVEPSRPPGQEAGWTFSGRGWGHGVGMCQVGAYAMARRGHSYVDILRHYYSGVEISSVDAVVAIDSE